MESISNSIFEQFEQHVRAPGKQICLLGALVVLKTKLFSIKAYALTQSLKKQAYSGTFFLRPFARYKLPEIPKCFAHRKNGSFDSSKIPDKETVIAESTTGSNTGNL